MIAARTDDGRFGAYRFPSDPGPGAWRPVLPAFVNDPNAWLKDVRPFLIESAHAVPSKGPLGDEPEVRTRVRRGEVGRLGDEHDPDGRPDARRPLPGGEPAADLEPDLPDLVRTAGVVARRQRRLFAMLYMTAADSLITVWNDKAHWPFWRPITAIREADTDGNPGTKADPGWLPLIPTPPYTEHSSGHSGLSGSFVATLQDFFCTDHIGWTDTNNGGLTRSFTQFSQAIDEIVEARVWSGIHFHNADVQGAKIGRQVAKWRERHFFKAVRTTTTDGETGGSHRGPPASRDGQPLDEEAGLPGPSDQRLEALRVLVSLAGRLPGAEIELRVHRTQAEEVERPEGGVRLDSACERGG